MILNKSKSNRKDRGFTIVELLVVIVVIAILAAITIVAYTGITSRAKTAQAQSNAQSAVNVIEIYFTDVANNAYPVNAAAIMAYTTGAAKIPAGITVSAAATNKPDNGEGQTVVRYMQKTTGGGNGGCVGYWDYGAATPNIKYLFAGAASAADFTAGTPTCT
jgi:prepilin-type N-terminal cleavage/methylation domain-containing protein